MNKAVEFANGGIIDRIRLPSPNDLNGVFFAVDQFFKLIFIRCYQPCAFIPSKSSRPDEGEDVGIEKSAGLIRHYFKCPLFQKCLSCVEACVIVVVNSLIQ